MKQNKKVIIGLGEVLWDVFPDKKILGGAPANFAYQASQLGNSGYIVSSVGDDELGNEVLSILEERKFNHLVEKVPYPTGTVQVTLDKGIPQYEICENVAWDNVPFTPQMKELAQKADAVCVGTLAQRSQVSRNTIKQFLDATPSTCLKIFDINLRQHFYTKEVIIETLLLCDILKINDEELEIIRQIFNLTDKSEEEACCWLKEEFKLQALILTKGGEGSSIFGRQSTSIQKTPKVEVVDTVGAGDAFTASFISACLAGQSITEAHKLAIEVSAYVCTQAGGMPLLPDSYIK